MNRRRIVAGLLGIAVVAGGCGPAILLGVGAAGAGAVVWYHGWLEQTIDEPQDRVFRAARSALADFDILVEDETLNERSDVLDAYDRDGRRVMVTTKVTGQKATRVRIRVGFWGSQQTSLRILEQLKKHL